MNHSPWIAQLSRIRPADTITSNSTTEVAIVGGGIAGVTSAYFLLTRTDKKVLIIEAGKIAHGATGHNAGQITSYFEMPFTEMVEKFGVERAAYAQKVINEDARVLLEEIVSHAGIQTPFSQFVGYDGWTQESQIVTELQNLALEAEAGLTVRPIMIAREWIAEHPIPHNYSHLYQIVSHADILSALQTSDKKYIAVTPFLSGCMNSALFSEELVGYLLRTYPERFSLYEHAPVHGVHLHKDQVVLDVRTYHVYAQYVVLCTNGFETLSIYEGEEKTVIDSTYHRNVEGVIGFMAAYLEPARKQPFTGSYNGFSSSIGHIITDSYDLAEPYFYVTRRPYDRGVHTELNLLSVGGPDRRLPEGDRYDPAMPYPRAIRRIMESFAKQTYDFNRPFDFYWHGLMGYTATRFRIIGHDPKQHRLLYNLGCNGVGILPSIYGSHRISRLLNNESVEPTIFDPQ